ncbi:hypothetical protein WMZ97_03315 [Lentibacillus sp. N15]|uniref:hypothetical protein n=1 Tax=Lentibacillus songyuanensis TaxID=3136161 RepID=UPI0031BBB87F
MERNNNNKSPIAALLWSLALPGFGQLYNRDFLLGIILMTWEIILNVKTNLNLALFYSFKGDFTLASQVVNYEWGLFYPSVFCFALWQAFNSAHSLNRHSSGKKRWERVYLTGFFIGMVTGMNMGINWYDGFLTKYSPIFNTPIFSGIAIGLIGAFIGHMLELLLKRFK